MANYNYKVKLHNIKAFAFDVDGVFTDGSLISTIDGELLRTFNAKDCMAMRMCYMKAFPVAIITGGVSASIVNRFRDLKVPMENIYQKSRDKVVCLNDFCQRYGITPENVAYIGDDLPDIGVMKICGLAVAPADAVPEVKEVCDYVSLYPGGKRVVRDLVEQVLKVHGKWEMDIDQYAAKF